MAGYIGTKSVSLSTDAATISGDLTIGGNLSLGDNDKAIFGAGSDLEIYHDGTNSYIANEVGTGSLISRSNRHRIQSDGGENMIEAIANAGVELYFDTSKKLETVTGGIDVTGTVTADKLNVTHTGGGDFIGVFQNLQHHMGFT